MHPKEREMFDDANRSAGICYNGGSLYCCDSQNNGRDDYPRPHHSYRRDEEVMADYLSGITKEEFGWTLEEKYNQIKPEERYLP